MEKEHHYTSSLTWIGNQGEGTSHYRAYQRDHTIQVKGKPTIDGSSDPSFRGSASRYNPEELLLSSISSCHMLWYLHLCSVNHIVVTDYHDEAQGIMMERPDGSGYFKEVTLHPVVTLTVINPTSINPTVGNPTRVIPTSINPTGVPPGSSALIERATALHHEAHKMCFIANSCNFPIRHNPVFRVLPAS